MRHALTIKIDDRLRHRHCCPAMTYNANFWCVKCKNEWKCPDKIIYYSSTFDEYGIIHKGQLDILIINNCPWCGKTLPQSKRKEWFNVLDNLNIDPWKNYKIIPKWLQKHAWWKKKSTKKKTPVCLNNT